jgi:type IV pilus biogenesis protein CpaD/CtpE
MRSLPMAPSVVAAIAAALLAGCSSQASSPSLPNAAAAPTNIAFSEHQLSVSSVLPDASSGGVGIRLASEDSATNKHYGKILG